MARSARLLVLLALLLPLGALPAQERGISVSGPSQQRVALVIGNGAYRDAPLKNPVNDSRQMTATLREMGFRVIGGENLTHPQMEERVREFGSALRSGAVGLFYFAGHGLQVGGRNYLVPVDATITKESEVKFKAVDLGFVLAQMEDAQNGLNLVVLDACRNNPFARSWRSASQGLAQVSAPTGTLIAYATAPGSVASDGDGANGLYTQELLRVIRVPGLPVEEVFKQVRIAVRQKSGGIQTPWEASSIMGHFSFLGSAQHAPAPAPALPVVPAPAPAGSAAAAASYERAKALREASRYAEAEPHGREAVRLEPTNARYNNELGLALSRQKKKAEAARYYREAVRLDPTNAVYNDNVASVMLDQQRNAEAEPYAREAVRLKPTDAGYNNRLGVILGRQEKKVEAERYYRDALRLDPSSPVYNDNLASALVSQKRHSEAEPYAREAVRLEPLNPRYNNRLGVVLSGQEKKAEAERYYREAVRLDPTSAQSNDNVAAVLLSQKRDSDAEPYARDAVRLEPGNAKYNNRLGVVLYQQGRYGEAETYFAAALRLEPGSTLYAKNLANARKALGRS